WVTYLDSASEVIERISREYENFFSILPPLIVSAPGRLDFLNTHQDYKGLPVVSVAINKRTYVALSRAESISRVVSVNLCGEVSECVDIFDAHTTSLREEGWFGNYVRSVIMALRERGASIRNFNMLISSEVPIASGLASSAALQVAVVTGLSELFGLRLSRQEIAELAYHSEHDLMGIPCGRLDQYGSVMGGVTLIETKPPFRTKTYNKVSLTFAVLDSGIKHSTRSVHSTRISELVEGLRDLLKRPETPHNIRALLSEDVYETRWADLKLEDLAPLLNNVSPASSKRILFTLKMHSSTVLALRLIEEGWTKELSRLVEDVIGEECPHCLSSSSESSDNMLRLLGGLINYQHVLLRDLYDVSTPELEIIRNKALEAGALGVKISGAGMGGSLLALVESREKGLEVIRQTRDVIRRGWVVSIDEGVRVDKNKLTK
ncbi:MAG: galactokinase family protein, partial [Zestosphaera sp.]